MMKIEKVYIGGWFQRTTLHLTEIYDFLQDASSAIGLTAETLEDNRKSLELDNFARKNWYLEYIEAKTRTDIGLRVYEDGLMVLEKENLGDFSADCQKLEEYYDRILSPAFSYLFSKGAPVPKELAQIKTLLPFIAVVRKTSKEEIKEFFEKWGTSSYSLIESGKTKVYKGAKLIIIETDLDDDKVRQLVEAQIFFREFKSQLHRYLNIHRLVWEEIEAIKEMGEIPGRKVKVYRSKLDSYQKTIKLIESRINQMGSYLATRGKVYAKERIEATLDDTFAYKFETLSDTLAYVKELWKMTDNYLSSAIQMFTEIQAESTKSSLSSLQLITTLGVVAGIIGYLGRDKLPYVTWPGVAFFGLLIIATWFLNRAVSAHFAGRSYKLRADEYKGMSWKVKEVRDV